MTETEQEYFKYLYQDRLNLANVLQAPYLEQIWEGVVAADDEAPSAIRELLQYADESEAISARFILEPDRLIFAHNGARFFSITDPFQDEAGGGIGTLNALTSPDLWKRGNDSDFARRARSLFQFTRTPEIYDPAAWLRVRDYIVPEQIPEDTSLRHMEETLFILPFDRTDAPPEVLYARAAEQLKSLSLALLFLPRLTRLEWRIGSQTESFSKDILEEHTSYGLSSVTYMLDHTVGDESRRAKYVLYSNSQEDPAVRLAFPLGERGELVPCEQPLYAVFPTREASALPFLAQGPFELLAGSGRLRPDSQLNRELDERLASLCVASLLNLRDRTEEEGYALMDADFLRSLFIHSSRFPGPERAQNSPLPKTYAAIRKLFRAEALLPAAQGYIRATDAYWTDAPEIFSLFSDEQLKKLTGNPNAAWLFQEDLKANRVGFLQDMSAYLDTLGAHKLTEQNLLDRGRVVSRSPQKPRATSPLLSESFIRAQDTSWLLSLYAWLAASPKRSEWARTAAIFPDAKGEIRPLYKNGKRALFLPPAAGSDEPFDVVNPALVENMPTRAFLQSLGIEPPPLKDQVLKGILPSYKREEEPKDPLGDFAALFSYYLSCPAAQTAEYLQELRQTRFLLADVEGEDIELARGNELYFPADALKAYFSAGFEARYLNLAPYEELAGPDRKPELLAFLEHLGVRRLPRLTKISYTQEEAEELGFPVPDSSRTCRYVETGIEGCFELLASMEERPSPAKSAALFEQLRALTGKLGPLEYAVTGECDYYTDRPQIEPFKPAIRTQLQTLPWLQLRSGGFAAPESIVLSDLHDRYRTEDAVGRQVLEFLEIRDDIADPRVREHHDLEQIGILCEQYKLDRSDLALLAAIKGEDAPAGTLVADAPESVSMPALPDAVKGIAQTVWDAARDAASEAASPDGLARSQSSRGAPGSLERRLETAQKQTIESIHAVIREEELLNDFKKSSKYTYGWLRRLFQFELLGDVADASSFPPIETQTVREETGSPDEVWLDLPQLSYPAWLDDADELALTIFVGKEEQTFPVDEVQPDQRGLRVRVSNPGPTLDWVQATKARLFSPSRQERLSWLQEQWQTLGLPDDFDLLTNLRPGTEFLLGAAGTGKTTRLVQRAVPSFLAADPHARILALGATETSADALMQALKAERNSTELPLEGLLRLGQKTDKDLDSLLSKSDGPSGDPVVCVSSVSRFLEEARWRQGVGQSILDHAWTHVLIDDAGLIPLGEILLLLYALQPTTFVISGDPCQIEPRLSADPWKNETIFTMAGLTSCAPDVPSDFPFDLQTLTRQFRSVPAIGELMNSMAYEGLLTHDRNASGVNLRTDAHAAPIAALNLATYPTQATGDGIYAIRMLRTGGSFSIYAGLLASAFIQSMVSQIPPGDALRIGILCPSRAQTELTRQLTAAIPLPEGVELDVGVPSDTYGKEFDVCLAVCLPPAPGEEPGHANEEELRLLQAAASRARDSLILLMPEMAPDSYLPAFQRVRDLCERDTDLAHRESAELEKSILGKTSYIRDHTTIFGPDDLGLDISDDSRYIVRVNEDSITARVVEPPQAEPEPENAAPAVREPSSPLPVQELPIPTTSPLPPPAAPPLSASTPMPAPLPPAAPVAPMQPSSISPAAAPSVQEVPTVAPAAPASRETIAPPTEATSGPAPALAPAQTKPTPKVASRKKRPANTPTVSFERVHSSQYGDGIIVDRKDVNGSKVLTVQFSGKRVNFLGDFAFRTGALTRIG